MTVGDVVRGRFEAWQAGDPGPFWSAVADDVTWTVVGTCPGAGTFRSRAELFERGVGAAAANLAAPQAPVEIEQVIADGDTAVVRWVGRAPTKDGGTYENHHCWVIRLDGEGRAVEVHAYLDTLAVAELCWT